VVWVNQYRKH